MAVKIETKSTFAASKPKLLFRGDYAAGSFNFKPNYDVSPDGQHFVMVKANKSVSAATQINVVLNWFEELKQRVPTEN